MKIHSTPIDGVKIVELKIYADSRGYFTERYREDFFNAHGISQKFVQDNHSRSAPKVLRGLHFQTNPAQGKLVGCTRGRIWDVAVDIRCGSPTYGKNFGLELSGENGLLLWIPGGLAHGFCVIGNDYADVTYKVDGYYSPESDGGVLWNDLDLAIKWPIDAPITSDKDARLPPFKALHANSTKTNLT